MTLARFLRFVLLVVALAATSLAAPGLAAAGTDRGSGGGGSGQPDLGQNVQIFDPSMPVSQIKAAVDAVHDQQVGNQFGAQRYALLFKPGAYGSAAEPLNFEVGYYTGVAGLGRLPGDVVINGSINVYNQCDNGHCVALNNFWRSLSNLTINVTNPSSGPYSGCYTGEFWAVSQAAPMRRITVNGKFTLMDYCTGPSFASGGFIADSRFNGPIVNGSQQQFYVRNSTLTSWSNGVWNQVFSGDVNAPAQCFPAQAGGCGPYTTLAATPASREKPYLYVDQAGAWRVFVPSAAANSARPTWSATTQTPGRSIPLSDFYLASPHDSALALDRQLLLGKNLLLTPGTYNVDHALRVQRADTVVLGLGFATLTPTRGNAAISVANVPGVDLAGLIVDAGPANSPVLVAVGDYPGALAPGGSRPDDPTALQDVFFRIGGPHAGRATVSLL
ncbi:MAG TPA: glycosyl hydrolase family 28-related protein, partial [Nakamurella sp.]